MAIVMPPIQSDSQGQLIVSLRHGEYVPESVLDVTINHALLWGCRQGLNQHLVIERLTGLTSEEITQRLARAQAVMRLENDYLARCVDVFTEDNALYVAMVTGEGQPLKQVTSGLTEQRVKQIGIEICNALNYLCNHNEFVHHAAIDTSTVFLTQYGRVKLTNLVALLDSTVTEPSDDVRREDVFGVGVTLFSALTGWQGDYRTTPLPLEVMDGNISQRFQKIIRKAVAENPLDRWENSMQLRFALFDV